MKILLATDGSTHAHAALGLLKRLPFPAGIEATALTVCANLAIPTFEERNPAGYAQLIELQREAADRALREVAEELRTTGWSLRSERRDGYVAQEILGLAAELPADLVAVGSRGLGRLRRYLLGSVSHRVVRHCVCSVLVGRPEGSGDAADAPPKIVLAFDGSDSAWSALRSLASLKPTLPTEVTIVHVLTLVTAFRMDVVQKLGSVFQAQEEAAATGLEEASKSLGAAGYTVKTELLEADDESDAILEVARREGADLIALGDRGFGAVERFLLGSVTTKVVHHADCSVLVVKGDGFDASPGG